MMDAISSSSLVACVAIVGMLATSLLLLAYYLFLNRDALLFFVCRRRRPDGLGSTSVAPSGSSLRGLEEAAIRRIPTFRYHHHQLDLELQLDESCAVCLAEFRDGDRLRLLPPCLHAFHIDCIDAWVAANATCPLCRAALVISSSSSTAGLHRRQDMVVIDIVAAASAGDDEPAPAAAVIETEDPRKMKTARRSLSMDSCHLDLQLQEPRRQAQGTDKLGEGDRTCTSTGFPAAGRPARLLGRSFFSFSHSPSAILPLNS